MPQERGTFFDILDATAHRGIDVRVVFWRPDVHTEQLQANAFWGSPEQVSSLGSLQSLIKIRWIKRGRVVRSIRKAGSSMLDAMVRWLSSAGSTRTRIRWWSQGIVGVGRTTTFTSRCAARRWSTFTTTLSNGGTKRVNDIT